MLTINEAYAIVKDVAKGQPCAAEHRMSSIVSDSYTVSVVAHNVIRVAASAGPGASFDAAIASLRTKLAALNDDAPATVRTGYNCAPPCNRECDDCSSCDSRCADLRQPDRRSEDGEDDRDNELQSQPTDPSTIDCEDP
jgi:hypothetical protein